MHLPTLIKYLVLAWGVPIAIVFVALASTPDPGQTRADFSRQTFRPERVWVAEKKGTRKSDHFELRIQSPAGEEFFHRDPERDPITDLYGRFPEDTEIRVYFSPSAEGNVLMEIAPTNDSSPPILSFESVIEEYASRRRFVSIVAAAWWVMANLFAGVLWKVDVSDRAAKQIHSDQDVAPDA